MRRDSFVAGAAKLVLGSATSRVLGAAYRIVVPILMGGGATAAVGMGLFGMAAPVYGVLLSATATGLPVAVARMVSARVSTGRGGEARAVLRAALAFVALAGLAFALLLYFGAPWYARHVARDERAALAVAAVAPAVLAVSLGAVLRGYLQGLRLMTPYALSQVIEQLARVVAIVALVVLLLPRGIEWAAAGASFGATVGGAASLAYLAAQVRRVRGELPRGPRASAKGLAGRHSRELVGLAVPISLSSMVLPLVTFIDALLVPSRLHAAGMGDRATALYGYLTGFATPFMILPTTFTAALALNLVPAVSEAEAQGDGGAVRRRVELAVRLALLVALPAGVGIAVLSRPIETVFFAAPQAAPILLALTPGVVVIGLQQVTSAALQGLGKPLVPMLTLFAGGAAKFLATYVLVADPGLNVRGAAIGTVVAFLVATVLNAAVLARMGYGVRWAGRLPAPLAASLGMGAVAWLSLRLWEATLLPALGARLGGALGLLVAILVGVAAYGILAVALQAVRPSDVLALPRVGRRLHAAGARMGLWPGTTA